MTNREGWLKPNPNSGNQNYLDFEMKTLTLCSVAVAMLASAALASDERVYDVSQKACQMDLSDSRVTFSGTSIGFWETRCDIVGEAAGANGARVLSLQCYGEGEEWSASATVTPQKAGGIEIKRDDYAQNYVPCN